MSTRVLLSLFIFASACLPVAGLVVQNNHDTPYAGALRLTTSLPDGVYAGDTAYATVHDGDLRGYIELPARGSVSLLAGATREFVGGRRLHFEPKQSGVAIEWQGRPMVDLQFGLAVAPGTEASATDAAVAFSPLALDFRRDGDVWSASASEGDYHVELVARVYPAGAIHFEAAVVRTRPATGPEYLALVRRVIVPDLAAPRMRWNGRVLNTYREPDAADRDFWYIHYTDWVSWQTGGTRLAVVNGFSPGLSAEERPGRWVNANHYHVYEHIRKRGSTLNFISEISGENPVQRMSEYVAPLPGESVQLDWMLSVADSPDEDWEHGLWSGFCGHRLVDAQSATPVANLGAPYVEFGANYFPYSTLAENFDYYRTRGMDREGWWPFSPVLWDHWAEMKPRMARDLRIVAALGFQWNRLHYTENVGSMTRETGLAFLDWFMVEHQKLGLRVLVDSKGSPEWMGLLAQRYGDVVGRFELENEVLIPGLEPDSIERWNAQRDAIRAASPTMPVHLTGVSNLGAVLRMERMGFTMDAVGVHSYKHDRGWMENLADMAVAPADEASTLGLPAILTEFNWKSFTYDSPESRLALCEQLWENLLSPRAYSEVYQFHLQETLCVNPSVARSGIRHYEILYLDLRPKPEAAPLVQRIRQYASPDAPFMQLPVELESVELGKDGKARAKYTLRNATQRPLQVKLVAECFDPGGSCRLLSDARITIASGADARGEMEIAVAPNAPPGVQHYFVRAEFDGKVSYGWGYTAKLGAPEFAAPLLRERVDYPQGPDIVKEIDWSLPTCVAFAPNAHRHEVEIAYMTFNTLQATTGRRLRLCSTDDIPPKYMERGNLILVGTPQRVELIAAASPVLKEGTGTIMLERKPGGRSWLFVTGPRVQDVQPAGMDFMLRYWTRARDCTMKISGMEKGAALGNRTKTGLVNPP